MATIILSSSTVPESEGGPFRVGTLGIQDRPNEAFVFALADHPIFEIVESNENGNVTYDLYVKADVAFDFETGPRRFELAITVADSTGSPVDVDPVVIDITNVNEAPTGITLTGGSVPDNADPGTVVATLEGEDPDEGDSLTYTFADENGPGTDLFEIVGNEIRVKAEIGDARAGTYQVQVKATDSKGLSCIQDVTLTVTSINEDTNVHFEPADVPVGTPGGRDVGTLTISEKDYTSISCTLTGENAALYTMARNTDGTWTVRIADGATIKTANQARVTVAISDGTNTIEWDIDVNLVENQAPEVLFDYVELNKTIAAGTKLGLLSAMNGETESHQENVNYQIVGDNAHLFRIGTDENGDLAVFAQQALTFSDDMHRRFTLKATDWVNEITQSFDLVFVNEAPTVSLTPETVMEGNPTNRVVARLTAEDPENDSLTYKLVGAHADLFKLEKTAVGHDIVLQPGVTLDYENAAHRALTVSVQVSDGDSTVTETMELDLADVDERPVVNFTPVKVNEGAGGRIVVGTIVATDPEGSDVIYELSDASANLFDLVANNQGGFDIVVLDGVTLDYENSAHRSLRVTASDGVNEVTETLTISLTDQVDLVTGTKRNDKLKGGTGSDILKGLAGNDRLSGGDGDDQLHGSLGRDVLKGEGGRDVFVFDSKPNKKTNLDVVWDYSVKDDAIWLDNKVFTKLGKAGSIAQPAALKKSFFAIDKAKDKDDYLIYNKKTGYLSYDADGSGSKAAVEIALLKKGLSMKAAEFFVI